MNTVGEGGGGHASRGRGGPSPAPGYYADFLVVDFFESDGLLPESDFVELFESDDFESDDLDSEDFDSELFESDEVLDEEVSDFSALRRDDDGLSVR